MIYVDYFKWNEIICFASVFCEYFTACLKSTLTWSIFVGDGLGY